MPVVLAVDQVGVGDAAAVGGTQELEVELGVHLVGRQLRRAGDPAVHSYELIAHPINGGGDAIAVALHLDVGQFLWLAERFAPARDRLFGGLGHEEGIVTLEFAVPGGHRKHRRPERRPARYPDPLKLDPHQRFVRRLQRLGQHGRDNLRIGEVRDGHRLGGDGRLGGIDLVVDLRLGWARTVANCVGAQRFPPSVSGARPALPPRTSTR